MDLRNQKLWHGLQGSLSLPRRYLREFPTTIHSITPITRNIVNTLGNRKDPGAEPMFYGAYLTIDDNARYRNNIAKHLLVIDPMLSSDRPNINLSRDLAFKALGECRLLPASSVLLHNTYRSEPFTSYTPIFMHKHGLSHKTKHITHPYDVADRIVNHVEKFKESYTKHLDKYMAPGEHNILSCIRNLWRWCYTLRRKFLVGHRPLGEEHARMLDYLRHCETHANYRNLIDSDGRPGLFGMEECVALPRYPWHSITRSQMAASRANLPVQPNYVLFAPDIIPEDTDDFPEIYTYGSMVLNYFKAGLRDGVYNLFTNPLNIGFDPKPRIEDRMHNTDVLHMGKHMWNSGVDRDLIFYWLNLNVADIHTVINGVSMSPGRFENLENLELLAPNSVERIRSLPERCALSMSAPAFNDAKEAYLQLIGSTLYDLNIATITYHFTSTSNAMISYLSTYCVLREYCMVLSALYWWARNNKDLLKKDDSLLRIKLWEIMDTLGCVMLKFNSTLDDIHSTAATGISILGYLNYCGYDVYDMISELRAICAAIFTTSAASEFIYNVKYGSVLPIRHRVAQHGALSSGTMLHETPNRGIQGYLGPESTYAPLDIRVTEALLELRKSLS